MNKHLITLGITVLLLTVGLSGCNEESDEIEEEFFTLSGSMINNFDEKIDVDYAIVTDEADGWEYWAPTIPFYAYENKDFSCDVKSGYSLYHLWVSWFYPNTDIQGYFQYNVSFSNPNENDLVYYVEIKANGEIEITTGELK